MSEIKENQNNSKTIEAIQFEDFDKLNLKSFGENLFKVIENSSNISAFNQSRSISLNAKFGNGKTTFLHMFKNFMKEKDYEVIFIDAWRSDFTSRPIVAILFELVNYFDKSSEIYKKLLSCLSIMANGYVKYQTGGIINPRAMFKSCKKIDEEKNYIFQALKAEKESINTIRNAISKHTKNKKLLIIVDELDRAKPDYAVKFLEDMKHFFDIEGVTFLFGVNKEQLKTTVKCLYGELDFDGYYRKFFQLDIDMPDIHTEAIKFIQNLIENNNLEFYEDSEVCTDGILLDSFKIFKFSLREIEEFLRMFEYLFNKKNREGSRKSIQRPRRHIYIFFICLRIKYKEYFERILHKEFMLQEFNDFLTKDLLKDLRNSNLEYRDSTLELLYWDAWFPISLCFCNSDEDKELAKELAKEFTKKFGMPEGVIKDEYARAILIFGDRLPPPHQICKNINDYKPRF